MEKGTAFLSLLHGFLKNKGMWVLHSRFSKKNRVIDLLGHGETECLSYVQTMEDNADAVHAVLSNCLRVFCRFYGRLCRFGLPNCIQTRSKVGFIKLVQADSAERKINRDRRLKTMKQSFVNFITLFQ
jgi:hypothetical protein